MAQLHYQVIIHIDRQVSLHRPSLPFVLSAVPKVYFAIAIKLISARQSLSILPLAPIKNGGRRSICFRQP